MIITDLSQITPLNKAINLKDVAIHQGLTKYLSILNNWHNFLKHTQINTFPRWDKLLPLI